MNCEICDQKFTKLKDLIHHGISDRHRYSHFFCMPCAQTYHSVTDVVEHIGTVEHSVLALATGMHFDTDYENPIIPIPSFPPHTCCLLCSYRGFLPIEEHVQSDSHKYLAFVIRTVIKNKELLCSTVHASYDTQKFISKMVNVRKRGPGGVQHHRVRHGPLPFVCELCNIHFSEPVYYTRHLENQCHKRMEKFLNTLSSIVKKIDIVDAGSCISVPRTFSNSFEALYYCEMCSHWLVTKFKYDQHKISSRHKDAESLVKSRRVADVTHRWVTAVRCKNKNPNLKKCKRRLEIEQHKKCVGDGGMNNDCEGEKASKMLKISPSPSSNPQVNGKEESVNKTVESHGTTTPTTPGVEAGETKSESSVDGFGDTDSSDDSEVENVSNPEEHYCELCDFLSYSSLHYGKHLTSKHHRRMKRMSDKKQEKAAPATQTEEPTDK